MFCLACEKCNKINRRFLEDYNLFINSQVWSNIAEIHLMQVTGCTYLKIYRAVYI